MIYGNVDMYGSIKIYFNMHLLKLRTIFFIN